MPLVSSMRILNLGISVEKLLLISTLIVAETKAELHEADIQRTALLSTLSNVKKLHVNCDGSLHILSLYISLNVCMET